MTTGEPDAGKARLSGSGRGRRKRTRATGTSPAAYFTRWAAARKRTSPVLAPRRAADPTSWITRCRRTVRDYERHPEHHAAMVQWAMVIVMTRRLARYHRARQPTAKLPTG
jgi:hypothetical protein